VRAALRGDGGAQATRRSTRPEEEDMYIGLGTILIIILLILLLR
jgi:hypothetical protein